jgi:hypothetical protein
MYMVFIIVRLVHFCSMGLTFGLVIFNADLQPRKAESGSILRESGSLDYV